jgi:PAS domain S-box-containing protein
VQLETTRTHKDSSELQVSLTVSPIRGPDGSFAGSVGITRDVAGGRRSEQIRAQLGALVDSAEDAIMSTDLDGYVTSWNGGAERLFGYTAEEMIGCYYATILTEGALEDFKHVLARATAGERLSHQGRSPVTRLTSSTRSLVSSTA